MERTRQVMQIVLGNTNDGVMLFDRDFRWQFVNRQAMNFQRFTPDVAYIGVSAFDMLRMQAQRGDFGPVDDIERVGVETADPFVWRIELSQRREQPSWQLARPQPVPEVPAPLKKASATMRWYR